MTGTSTVITSNTGIYLWSYSIAPILYDPNYISGPPIPPPPLPVSANPSTSTDLDGMLNRIYTGFYKGQVQQPFSDHPFYGGFENLGPSTGLDPVNGVYKHTSPVLVGAGESYDTGTVQVYAVSIDYYVQQGDNTGVRQWFWYYYAPSLPPLPPVSTAEPITLDLLRLSLDTYTPKAGQEAILEKYRPGVKTIRGTFQGGARTAVIVGNNKGGFIIYEEVGGAPSGNCYVYDYDRTLIDVVAPDGLIQYSI